MSVIKHRKNVPIVIVEDHHEVVPHIHRNIASKHLPFSDLTLVHFDSHPDMLIPVEMTADTVFDKTALYDTLSIENWILPLVYAGHIRDIYWLKPPWCQQIQASRYTFYVGKCSNTGTIRTTCKENYFVSETLYVPEYQLVDKKLVSLQVLTVEPEIWTKVSPTMDQPEDVDRVVSLDAQTASQSDSTPTDVNTDNGLTNAADVIEKKRKDNSSDACAENDDSDARLRSCLYSCLKNLASSLRLENRHFILDIDLDFYSTKNPFQKMYSAEQMSLLKKLYEYTGPKDSSDQAIQKCVADRKQQLSEIKSALLTLSKDNSASLNMDVKRLALTSDLVASIQSSDLPPDFELLHEAGCTMDDTELPHHVSSEKQICALVQETKQILEALPRPALITLSRSSVDDYCPPDQVDYIEEAVTLALEEVYVYTDVQKHYIDSEEESTTS